MTLDAFKYLVASCNLNRKHFFKKYIHKIFFPDITIYIVFIFKESIKKWRMEKQFHLKAQKQTWKLSFINEFLKIIFHPNELLFSVCK